MFSRSGAVARSHIDDLAMESAIRETQLLCRLAYWVWTLWFLVEHFFLPVFLWNEADVSFICVFLSPWRLTMFAAPFGSWWYAKSLLFARHWVASNVISFNSVASSGSGVSLTLPWETPFMSWTFSFVLGTTGPLIVHIVQQHVLTLLPRCRQAHLVFSVSLSVNLREPCQ